MSGYSSHKDEHGRNFYADQNTAAGLRPRLNPIESSYVITVHIWHLRTAAAVNTTEYNRIFNSLFNSLLSDLESLLLINSVHDSMK